MTTTDACSSGTPLTSAPPPGATLSAVSTASAPEFIGSTMSLAGGAASSAQNGPSRSWWKARLVSVEAVQLGVRGRHQVGVPVPEVEGG